MSLRSRIANLLPTRQKSTAPAGSVGPSGIPMGWPINFFQYGYKPHTSHQNSVVEACAAAYAQTIAQLPLKHYRKLPDGSLDHIKGSSIQKVLNRPNDFQTRSDFLLNLIHSMYRQGNGYFFSFADPRSTDAIYLLDSFSTQPHRASETGDVFYQTSGEWVEVASPIENTLMIPSRYVGHVRLHTPQDPLVGVTPVQSVSGSVAVNNAISNTQASFFGNMSRPSGVLTTDVQLSKDQMTQLREAWEAQSKGMNAGGTPILSNGLKWESLTMTAVDSQLVESNKMTIEDISRAFRVPPMIINNMENSTFNNAEALMTFWLASGLGFLIDHLELVFSHFFRLPDDQMIELDTEVLLRTDFAARIAALGEGVTKGIIAPNEARNIIRLAPVEGGDMPRVQQQMVPLDYEEPEPVATLPPPEPAAEEPGTEAPEQDDEITDEELAMLPYLIKAELREMRNGHR